MSELENVSEFADGEKEDFEDNAAETDAMAPTVSIETVSVVRPVKVIGILSSAVAVLFFGLSIAATEWVKGGGRQEGLWMVCDEIGDGIIQCIDNTNPSRDWMNAVRAMMIIAITCAFSAVVVGSVGVTTSHFDRKYSLYMATIALNFFACIPAIIALILFPIKFVEENSPPSWTVGWNYIAVCIGTALLILAGFTICVDRSAEEIQYREKTCYHNESIEEYIPE